jgi:hypothetical protein
MFRHFATAIALALPLTLAAQQPDAAPVPRELALALLGFAEYSQSKPTITIGMAPVAYVTAAIPRMARVLGGARYPSRRGENERSTTILVMRETPDSALAIMSAHLERAGWRPPPAPDWDNQGFALIGPTMPGHIISYCGDSSVITASIVDDDGNGSIVRLGSHRPLRNTMCDPEFRERFMSRGGRDGVRLPTLRPPSGASGVGGGSCGGGDSRSANAEMQSLLSAADMVAHYAAQLREQGWTLGNRATEGDLSVQTARRTDENGLDLFLTLTDVRIGQRDHSLTLRVFTPSRRER